MAAGILKRVSPPTEAAVAAIAEREGRSFITQLDRIVAAGLEVLGEDVPAEIAPQPASTAKGKTKR